MPHAVLELVIFEILRQRASCPDITSSVGSLDFRKSRHRCDVWRIRFVLACGRRMRDVATQATQAWLHGVCKAAIYHVCGVLEPANLSFFLSQ